MYQLPVPYDFPALEHHVFSQRDLQRMCSRLFHTTGERVHLSSSNRHCRLQIAWTCYAKGSLRDQIGTVYLYDRLGTFLRYPAVKLIIH